MDRWTRICRLDELPVLGARGVERRGADNVAVFRTASDRIFALRDRCPHKGGPLSQGIVYGERVACPLHNWNVDRRSGCAIAPDEGCVESFPIRVDAGMVYLGVRAEQPASAVLQVGADD